MSMMAYYYSFRFKEKLGVVVDWTMIDEKKKERRIPKMYSGRNVLVVRMDIVRSHMEEGTHMEGYRE